MVQELLVVLACLNSKGCSETSGHYYNTHPEVKELVKEGKDSINAVLGRKFVDIVGPFILVTAGGSGTIRISKGLSLQGNKEKTVLNLTWEF